MVFELLRHRLIDHLTPETLADELYFHFYGKDTIGSILEGTPLINIKRRGTLSKGTVPADHRYLVFRIPKNLQPRLLEPATLYPYENGGYGGVALKTPLPAQYLHQAESWYRMMMQENEYYREFPESIPSEDFRCLPAQYCIAGIKVLGRYKFYGRHLHIYDHVFPYSVSFLPEIPNRHDLTPNIILKAMEYYKRMESNENQRY